MKCISSPQDVYKRQSQGNGIDKTVKTENGGQIQVDNLMPGVYTVTEQEYDRYEMCIRDSSYAACFFTEKQAAFLSFQERFSRSKKFFQIFLRVRVCICPLPVGISEGTKFRIRDFPLHSTLKIE